MRSKHSIEIRSTGSSSGTTSDVRYFEYMYTRPKVGFDGESLGSCYMVGLVSALVGVERYSEAHGVYQSRAWWGVADHGVIFEGPLGETSRLQQPVKNACGRAFGSGDRIGFAVDMRKALQAR